MTLNSMPLGWNNCSYSVTTSGSSVLMKPVIGGDRATAIKPLNVTDLLLDF